MTKEEMNPMTGRKEVLQLVYPGGVPRGVSKISYKGARGATVLPASTDTSPLPPLTESAAQTPSKSPPAWAIPAPGSKEALISDMMQGSRDTSPDSSPQFVIPTAAPAAWPSLTEIASGRTESMPSRAPSSCGGVRPSAKDVVTGCAAATKLKEIPKKMMMPLVVAGSKTRGQRLVTSKESGLLPSPTEGKLAGSEHALSTMPSAELSSSRARLDIASDGPLDNTTSPASMSPAPTACELMGLTGHELADASTSSPVDSHSSAEGSSDADKENTADSGEGEVFTPRSAPAVVVAEADGSDSGTSSTGLADTAAGAQVSGALSARDLLPASLEDILEDPVADVQPRAASENGGADKVRTDYTRPSLDSHVVMPARRKQSRFAFVTTPVGKGSSMSLPHDLDSMNAPTVAPEALLGHVAAPERRTGDSSPSSTTPARPAFDKSMLPEDIMQALYAQQEQPNAAAVAAAAAATAAANARMHAPVAPGTLEQPPMTHESVVQAVSAQLQAIMSHGSGGATAKTLCCPPSWSALGSACEFLPYSCLSRCRWMDIAP